MKRDVSTRLQTLTAASPAGIAHAGRDGRLLYVNQPAEADRRCLRGPGRHALA